MLQVCTSVAAPEPLPSRNATTAVISRSPDRTGDMTGERVFLHTAQTEAVMETVFMAFGINITLKENVPCFICH